MLSNKAIAIYSMALNSASCILNIGEAFLGYDNAAYHLIIGIINIGCIIWGYQDYTKEA